MHEEGIEDGKEYVIITLNSGSSYRADGLLNGVLSDALLMVVMMIGKSRAYMKWQP